MFSFSFSFSRASLVSAAYAHVLCALMSLNFLWNVSLKRLNCPPCLYLPSISSYKMIVGRLLSCTFFSVKCEAMKPMDMHYLSTLSLFELIEQFRIHKVGSMGTITAR